MRFETRRRRIQAVIPVKEDQKNNRRALGRCGDRPPAFDATCYRERNTVERCFSKLKQFRAVARRRTRIRSGWPAWSSISGAVTGPRTCGRRFR
jgi:transposase